MTRLSTVVAALAASAQLFAAASFAHPGHDHKLMGTVEIVDGDYVIMKTTDGNELTFRMDQQSRFLNGDAEGSADDIVPGLRVLVNVGDGEEPLVAKEIRYAGDEG